MNQRAHVRHRTDLPALLTFSGYTGQPCQVRDFCLGGMLLCLPASPSTTSLAENSIIYVKIQIDGERRDRCIELQAIVRHKNGTTIGIAFQQPNAGDLLAVQQHVLSVRHSSNTPDTQYALSSQQDQAAAELIRLTRQFVLMQLEQFFPAAREALFVAADKAGSNEKQHPFFAASKLLEIQSNAISQQFFNHTIDKLERLKRGESTDNDPNDPSNSSNRLSLIDKNSFDDWVKLKVLATQAENRFYDQLLPLQLRLDELFHISLKARSNPLHPMVFCDALNKTLAPLPLKRETDQILLTAFNNTLLAELGGLYDDANQTFATLGILPELDIGQYLSHHYAPPVSETETEHNDCVDEQANGSVNEQDDGTTSASEAAKATESTAQAPQQVPQQTAPALRSRTSSAFHQQQHIAKHAYKTVRKLLDVQAGSLVFMPFASQDQSMLPVADDKHVDSILSELQHNLNQQTHQQTPLAERIAAAINKDRDTPAQARKEVQEAIQVIHHLFEGIVDNPLLTPNARASIRRLEVPFLRLLLKDDAFLTQEDHPARIMLNRLAKLGVMGGPSHAEANQDAIDEKVQDVLVHFDRDVAVFKGAVDKLDKAIESQQARYDRKLKRITERYEGKQKLKLARRGVNRTLEQHIGGKEVPKALLSLLDAGWRQLLVLTRLRHGDESKEWQRNMDVINQLLTAVDSTPSSSQLRALLAQIKLGLQQVDHTQLQNKRLVAELRELLSQSAENTPAAPMVSVPAGLVDAEDTPAPSKKEAQQIRRASHYSVGDWFSQQQDTLVRLAWVNNDGTTFVFIDHQSMEVAEMTVADFTNRLATGAMRPTDNPDAPAMDRGLEKMVRGIYDQMADQARHDSLTGLLNRQEFEHQLKQRLASQPTNGTLLHIDIDQFKVVNNYAGPDAGDELIVQLGQRIKQHYPEQLICRLSGDEYAVWQENTAQDTLKSSTKSLSKQIAAERFICSGTAHSITVSIGVTNWQPGSGSASELMRRASNACLEAKENGRNRTQYYEPDSRELAERDDLMAKVAHLNEALDKDQLLLRCQRIEATDSGSAHPASYEILVSVADEEGDMAAPAEFLQAAERYNRMHALDRWVITNALRWMHNHPDDVNALDHISINLSGHSLNDDSLLEFLFDTFQRYPVPYEHICFEVTETAAIASLDDAVDFIEEIQRLGCRFSLDDFGSGFASYGYLKQLPVDFIKIDGSFIRNLTDDPANQALVRSINELGHLMGKRTIAEYVENDDIRRCLHDIGVDFVQGYGVERPRLLDSLANVEVA